MSISTLAELSFTSTLSTSLRVATPSRYISDTLLEVARQQKRVAMSDMLPSVVLVGSYEFSNPKSIMASICSE